MNVRDLPSTSRCAEPEPPQHQTAETRKQLCHLLTCWLYSFPTNSPLPKTETEYKRSVSSFHVVKVVHEDLRAGRVSGALELTSAVPRVKGTPDWDGRPKDPIEFGPPMQMVEGKI